MKKKILIVPGSMRKNSFNKRLALLGQELLGDRAETEVLEYGDIPFMNQDLEGDLPSVLTDIRQTVLGCDGIWIFTPEYNGSIPGVLKNLLDWLSRDYGEGSPVKGKPVTASGAGGRRATRKVRDQLNTLFMMMQMRAMEAPQTGIALDAEAFSTDCMTLTPEQQAELAAQADAFLAFIKETPVTR